MKDKAGAIKLLGTALPDFVIEQVSTDRTARILCERACGQLFGNRISFYEVLKNSLFYIEARERLRDKACFSLSPSTRAFVADLTFYFAIPHAARGEHKRVAKLPLQE
jgi:hypothetical protein